mmetsp:Transcript_10110/g.16412  ORF Transcript_10110/g.16412 Transcript_10110/m.16412 type:complete len:114 (-) Transcript_10110:340-681(-)
MWRFLGFSFSVGVSSRRLLLGMGSVEVSSRGTSLLPFEYSKCRCMVCMSQLSAVSQCWWCGCSQLRSVLFGMPFNSRCQNYSNSQVVINSAFQWKSVVASWVDWRKFCWTFDM